MTKLNPHLGSTFKSWLDEDGIREDVTSSAIKAVIALQITQAMKTKGHHQTCHGAANADKPR